MHLLFYESQMTPEGSTKALCMPEGKCSLLIAPPLAVSRDGIELRVYLYLEQLTWRLSKVADHAFQSFSFLFISYGIQVHRPCTS